MTGTIAEHPVGISNPARVSFSFKYAAFSSTSFRPALSDSNNLNTSIKPPTVGAGRAVEKK